MGSCSKLKKIITYIIHKEGRNSVTSLNVLVLCGRVIYKVSMLTSYPRPVMVQKCCASDAKHSPGALSNKSGSLDAQLAELTN